MIVLPIWGSFLEPFGSILASKRHSKIEQNFGCDFGGEKGAKGAPFGVGPAECAGSGGKKEGGHKDHLGKNFRKKNLAKNQGLGQEALESNLARRPGWGGGALRAFRRAEIIVGVVLFESCVGGVAVAMMVASIFYFEFWFLWVSF